MPVSRLRFKDVMESRLPSDLGVCQSNWIELARLVNSAQESLLTCPEAPDTGWWGGYAEMVFNVSRNSPKLVLAYGSARLISVNACTTPIPIRNQFHEYLRFGSGNWPKTLCDSSGCSGDGNVTAYRRSVACTFADLTATNQFLRIYPTETADYNKTVVISGLDANGAAITSLEGGIRVNGVFARLTTPFVDVTLPGTSTPLEISALTGVQKEPTLGRVSIYQVDIDTAASSLLLTMEPGEKVAAYQCYYLGSLPQGCCSSPNVSDDSLVQLTAIVKLDLVPVVTDSDYLLIQSREAIIAECQSIRYSEMDSSEAVAKSAERHRAAVRYLNGQLIHYEGKEQPAVSFRPFGSATLNRQRIGKLM